MSASLLEMVLAIAIAGLIFAGAIIPTTNLAVAYQRGEALVRQATAESLAAVRVEQIFSTLWRDPQPPGGHGPLQAASRSRMRIGDWQVGRARDRLEQRRQGVPSGVIAEPVANVSFQYLLTDGSWVSQVRSARRDDVLALRFSWTDRATGRRYQGAALAPDRAFSGNLIELPEPDTGTPYRREDYMRTAHFSLESW